MPGGALFYMINKKAIFVFVISFLALFTFNFVLAADLEAPIISEVNENIKSFQEPFILGFVEKNLDVLVYVDDEYLGLSPSISSGKEKDRFYFYINKAFSSGLHKLVLIGRNSFGVLTSPSNEFFFSFSETIDQIALKARCGSLGLIFSGEAGAGNVVYLYKNNNNIASYETKNSRNFVFNLSEYQKDDLFSVLVKDAIGRESFMSESIKAGPCTKVFPENGGGNETTSKEKEVIFNEENINKKNIPSISLKAETEKIKVKGVDRDFNENSGSAEKIDSIQDSDINPLVSELINQEVSSSSTPTTKQDKFKTNLLVFFGFLIAIIAWVVWINRELSENSEENDEKNGLE